MKLIIQIPCFNEEQTLAATVADLPHSVPGFDTVEFLIIDDGSRDRTAEVASACGVHHVVRHSGNQGLARAFMTGLAACVDRGADVIVNTDADNQYCAADIGKIVQPILDEKADLVVGSRPIATIQHFSPMKRLLQKVGSSVVRRLSRTEVDDAPSGFRAITRRAALQLNVFNAYTYTLETIIQAGRSNLRVVSVPIRVNGPTRPSRLMRSIPEYLRRSIMIMLSTYLIYRPTKVFGVLATVFFVPAVLLALRYVYLAVFEASGRGHVQSVIASGMLATCGVFMLAIGTTAHLLGINRRLLEDILYLERLHGRSTTLPAILARPDSDAPVRQAVLPEADSARGRLGAGSPIDLAERV